MKKSLRIGSFILTAVVVAWISGCEWDSSSDSSSWNDRWNWINFSGVYRAVGGGILITSHAFSSQTVASSSTTNQTVVPVGAEVVDTGNNGSVYNGTLVNTPVLAGSVQITAGGFNLVDDGAGALTDAPATGNIDYDSGAWSVNLAGNIVVAGEDIVARYAYVISDISGGSSGSTGRGTSGGITVYSWVVHQEGNKLTITDNNGSVYSGQLGSVRSSAGFDQDDAAVLAQDATGTSGSFTPADGEHIIAQFSASGTSAGNKQVEMVGSFEGTVEYPPSTTTQSITEDSTQVYFIERRMQGTWIEKNGVSADIVGAAAPSAVTVSRTFFQ